MKRLTRRQVRARLAEVRACLIALRTTGESDSIDGRAVILHDDGEWYRVEYMLTSFIGCVELMLPPIDLASLRNVRARMSAGEPMPAAEIDAALTTMKAIERGMMGLTHAEVAEAVLTERIAIEFDEMEAA